MLYKVVNSQSKFGNRVVLDTGSLINEGKLREDGEDLRIVYWNGTRYYIELDRINETQLWTGISQICFRLQKDISAGEKDDNYFIYYGNPTPPSAPKDKRKVYLFWDDFDDKNYNGWTIEEGKWAAEDGYLRVKEGALENWINPNLYLKDFVIKYKWWGGDRTDGGVLYRSPQNDNDSGYIFIVRHWDMYKVWDNYWHIRKNDKWGPKYSIKFYHFPEAWIYITNKVFNFKSEVKITDQEGNLLVENSFEDITGLWQGGWINFYGVAWSRGKASFDDIKICKYTYPEPLVKIGLEIPFIIKAVVNIDPDTSNLKSKGRWITCYISLPQGYSVKDININTVELGYKDRYINAEWGEVQNDVLMVKFSREALLKAIVPEEGEIILKVKGKVKEIPFEGEDKIKIIKPFKNIKENSLILTYQSYPNPCKDCVWIPFKLESISNFTLKVYNISGQLIRTFHLDFLKPGDYISNRIEGKLVKNHNYIHQIPHALYLDLKDSQNNSLPSGVYFYQLIIKPIDCEKSSKIISGRFVVIK